MIEAAKKGFVASGVELNPWLVLYSKVQALRLGLTSKTSFKRKDIWKTPLGPYDNVVIFGVDTMVKSYLENKASRKQFQLFLFCR